MNKDPKNECRACITEKPWKLASHRHTCSRNPSPEHPIDAEIVADDFVLGFAAGMKESDRVHELLMNEARESNLQEAIGALEGIKLENYDCPAHENGTFNQRIDCLACVRVRAYNVALEEAIATLKGIRSTGV